MGEYRKFRLQQVFPNYDPTIPDSNIVSGSAPQDLIEYADDHGIFLKEKYVSFDYDYNALEGMKYNLNESMIIFSSLHLLF